MAWSLDDILAFLAQDALEEWFQRTGWTREDIASQYEHGIPDTWAKGVFEARKLPIEAWPKVLKTPSLHRGRIHPTIARRTMELIEAARPTPVKVKIATTLNRTKSEAKKLLLAAGKPDKILAEELTQAGLKASRSTVSAWHSGDRAIPVSHAEWVRKKYKVPLSAWPKVA